MRIRRSVLGTLILIVSAEAALLGVGFLKDLSPQQTIVRATAKLLGRQEGHPWVGGLPDANRGIIAHLDVADTFPRGASREAVRQAFGIHWSPDDTLRAVPRRYTDGGDVDGVSFEEGWFRAYDGVEIPYLQILPPGFRDDRRYPTVVLYSGHGAMRQVAFDEWSYQRGAGLELARNGFLVFAMENRGMGQLYTLGEHLRIDAVARLTGGSWYGEITTDALFLLDLVFQHPNVDGDHVGVGGVSTGGALSLLTAALDSRVAASFVQGYLGSYRTTFGTSGAHDLCNNIFGIVGKFDMDDIAVLAFPTPLLFVNGMEDKFDYLDARAAFEGIDERYTEGGFPGAARLETPAATAHEFSTDLALGFFRDVLIG